MFSKFNTWLAAKATIYVSTMACVYAFTIWSILPLIWPDTRDAVFYVSGGILQLVLLPLIMVGNSVLSAASEARAAADHTAVMEILSSVRHVMTEEDDETSTMAEIKKLLTSIDQKLTAGVPAVYE